MIKLARRWVPDFAWKAIKSTKFAREFKANQLSSTSKRLDICAAQFAHNLHLSGINSIAGKSCLEIGSGWVLSHAVVCYLLGAKKVFTTDILPHACPQALWNSIHKSIYSIVRDVLSPFESHSNIRARLDRLISIKYFDFNVLEKLGIYYCSPLDFSKDNFTEEVDFIFSNSVLEHICREDIEVVLNNLTNFLRKGGGMIHSIHLEDHLDINNRPFEFLSIPNSDFDRLCENARGNRVRSSEWREIFSGVANTKTKILYEWLREDKELPKSIDQSIKYENLTDLRTSHIGVLTEKL